MLSRRQLLCGSALPAMLIAGHYCPLAFSARHTPTLQHKQQQELISMLVNTPHEELFAELLIGIQQGLHPQELLTALALACAEHIEPYPTVGFKYHALMMLSAVYKALLQGPSTEQWLHLFWAADSFKRAQQRDKHDGDWQMSVLPQRSLPRRLEAEKQFVEAMEAWDAEAADIAIVQLARLTPPAQLFDHLFYYGARDFRDIGHKIIAVSNCHRLLQIIGWQHAEPILRSTVYALLNHEGESNPATSDLSADRSWRANRVYRQSINNWNEQPMTGDADAKISLAILAALRDEPGHSVGKMAVEIVNQGANVQLLWDAVFLAAANIIARDSGIIGVHANTSVNALYYAFQHCSNMNSRQLLLLQALSYIPMYQALLRKNVRSLSIEDLAEAMVNDDVNEAMAEIFDVISDNRLLAAGKVMQLMNRPASMQRSLASYRALARHYTLYHNTGYHDYKFTEAVFENAESISTPWKARYLSASVFYLNGAKDAPNKLIQQAQAILM